MEAKQHIESLFSETRDYLETRIDLYKLKAVDKSSDAISSLATKGVLLLLFCFFILALNTGIAFLLGEWLGKFSYGFFIVAGFYMILLLVFYSRRNQWLKTPLADKLIEQFLK